MTRYQTPSESPPTNSMPPTTTNHSQPEVNSSNMESRMAKLVGLEEEYPSSEDDLATNGQQPFSQAPEPQELQTAQTLSSNPFAKVGVVGAGTLALVVFAGLFLSQIMGGGNQNTVPQVEVPQTPAPETLNPEEQLQQEVETLKTKLALAEQAEAVKAAQRQLRNVRPTPSPRATPEPVQRPEPRVVRASVPQRTPTPARTVYVPRVVERVVRVPQPVRPQPQPRVVPPPVVQPSPPPVLEVTPPPTPDPLEEWARLAKLGSYGQMSAETNPEANTTTIAAAKPLTTPRPRPPVTQRPPIQTPPRVATTSRTKSLKVGTRANAELATAISGESGSGSSNAKSNSDDSVPVIVELTQDLKAADGSVAAPQGAEVEAVVSSISKDGLVQLDVKKISWEENGQPIEKTVPNGALKLRGSGGRPLVAEEFPGEGSNFASDVRMFALGGVGKAAELINRPEQRIVSLPTTSEVNGQTTTSTTTTVQTEPRRNVAAGIFEGGTRVVVPNMIRREQINNRRNRQQRTNIWYMPEGTEVELFVSRRISL
jgi:hypothetical protein